MTKYYLYTVDLSSTQTEVNPPGKLKENGTLYHFKKLSIFWQNELSKNSKTFEDITKDVET